ncbi:T9SS type A sorting domain-containing protein [Carboxylicivirga sediminis]|uniref:T9SS type A sorting domain-containing protein n=1 Tax=Carboxylicivirga sediminis TaxID=2006564 RepID=A0A941J2T6_9BACT|nr:chondroitinase family polysaccharide lyase [Carboxylicivirga sediminis]MBR8538137.1 T9SS type A sorting domain-containing protein [Carboxylicivirga sediminis]
MKALLFILSFCITASLCAQNYLGLEGIVPDNWNPKTNLSISSAHYKMGTQSLKWEWTPGSQIAIDNPSGMAQACQTYKGGMILWIYNETAKDADLKFEFLSSNAAVQYYFTYHLNFTGWRACWIRFDEDMMGSKSSKNLTSMRIKAPSTSTGGVLYFDRMRFPATRINDRVTPDAQLSYINPDMNANHWAALWHWHSTYSYELELPTNLTNEEIATFANIRERITANIAGSAPSASRVTAIRNQYAALNIQRNGSTITGAAFVSADEYVSTNGDKRFNDLDNLMYDMAKAWYHNKEQGFDVMFCDILDWLYDQGLTVGSGMGTNHHYGYYFRGFPKAIWLMKDTLVAQGKFQEAFEMIQYWTGVPEVRQLPQVDNFQGIVDAWNTIIPGRLTAIMLRDDSPELARDMQAFTNWMDGVMQYSVGTVGGFKPDGSGFHHGMLYAGYMNGGYAGLGEVLNYVGNTIYNLSAESRERFKKALIVHAGYANYRSFVNSVCGRNPMDQELGTGAINAFAYLAKATDPIDAECAAEYMRLTKYKKELYDEFVAQGITPASAPTGNTSVNYGALNMHRRDNWLVATKGFNNIVTGTEIYTSNNRYGRYQSYGTVQILGAGEPVSASESGFKLEGWDWNRFPGATTIHLPYEALNYAGGNINERSKNSSFAGACSLDGNGVFGMILDENDYTNYTDDFVARKSVFTFDNRIICLGSNISNSNDQYHTETTLFQNALSATSDNIIVDASTIGQFPYSKHLNTVEAITLMDAKDNGYFIPEGTIHVMKSNQESRDNKSKAVNYGDYATAWLDHGAAPSNASYEYAILVQSSVDELNTFKQDMESSSKPYQVLRKDEVAHIVYDRASASTGYVMFEANADIESAHIVNSSYPCIMVVKEQSEEVIQLAFSDPSINMEAPTTLIGTAIAEERLVKVKLNGRFKLQASNDKCRLVEQGQDYTILEFTSIHGLSVEVELIRNPASTNANGPRDSQVKIFPNPVHSFLNYSGPAGLQRVTVLTLDGKHLLQGQPGKPIYVGNLSAGVYLMQLNYQDRDELVRFVKA